MALEVESDRQVRPGVRERFDRAQSAKDLTCTPDN